MKIFPIALLFLTVLVVGCSSTSSKPASGYEPVTNPSDFTTIITNPYFPLHVGWTWKYTGIKDGHHETDIMHVTSTTRVIEGVHALAISDISYLNGKVGEKTTDWYAQDKKTGDVWYFGEQTAEYLPNGQVDTSGTWESGVNDGEPGIIMPANPAIPIGYRQEFLAGQAEDTAWTVNTAGSVTVPWGTAAPVLTSLEFSRLEPDVVDQKIYAPGVGEIKEQALTGPQEIWQLVRLVK